MNPTLSHPTAPPFTAPLPVAVHHLASPPISPLTSPVPLVLDGTRTAPATALAIPRIVAAVAELNQRYPAHRFSARDDGGLVIKCAKTGERASACPHPGCQTHLASRRSNCISRHFQTAHAPDTLLFACPHPCSSRTNRPDHLLAHLARKKAACATRILLDAHRQHGTGDMAAMMRLVYAPDSGRLEGAATWQAALVRDTNKEHIEMQLAKIGAGVALQAILEVAAAQIDVAMLPAQVHRSFASPHELPALPELPRALSPFEAATEAIASLPSPATNVSGLGLDLASLASPPTHPNAEVNALAIAVSIASSGPVPSLDSVQVPTSAMPEPFPSMASFSHQPLGTPLATTLWAAPAMTDSQFVASFATPFSQLPTTLAPQGIAVTSAPLVPWQFPLVSNDTPVTPATTACTPAQYAPLSPPPTLPILSDAEFEALMTPLLCAVTDAAHEPRATAPVAASVTPAVSALLLNLAGTPSHRALDGACSSPTASMLTLGSALGDASASVSPDAVGPRHLHIPDDVLADAARALGVSTKRSWLDMAAEDGLPAPEEAAKRRRHERPAPGSLATILG